MDEIRASYIERYAQLLMGYPEIYEGEMDMIKRIIEVYSESK